MDPSPSSLPPCEAKPASKPASSSQTKRKRKPTARKRRRRNPAPAGPLPPLDFPRFPELPAELRLAIWESALPAGPRLVQSRILGVGTIHEFGDAFSLAHVGPPPLFWACREAREVMLRGLAAAALRGGWADLRNDVLFVPFLDRAGRARCRGIGRRIANRAVKAGAPAPERVGVHDAAQIAVKMPWYRKYIYPLVQFVAYHDKLTRLFLVVSCDRPTQEVLEEGWLVADRIHERCQSVGMWRVPKHPLPEIIILLQRRKFAFQPGTWSMDLENFLSKFTVVPFKPDHKAKIGRHGVLRSILPV